MSLEESQVALAKVEKSMKGGNTIAIGEITGDKGYAPLIFNPEK